MLSSKLLCQQTESTAHHISVAQRGFSTISHCHFGFVFVTLALYLRSTLNAFAPLGSELTGKWFLC